MEKAIAGDDAQDCCVNDTRPPEFVEFLGNQIKTDRNLCVLRDTREKVGVKQIVAASEAVWGGADDTAKKVAILLPHRHSV